MCFLTGNRIYALQDYNLDISLTRKLFSSQRNPCFCPLILPYMRGPDRSSLRQPLRLIQWLWYSR